jgi:3-phosphoshikimate 1-carboxyvinyltransferase
MAMSFAVLGLRAPGVRIADPGCVAKTFPDFFTRLAEAVGRGAEGPA